MLSFMTQTLTRKRPAFVTDHGNSVPDYDATATATLDGWTVQPGTTDVDRVNRQGVMISWTAIGPADADVLATDHFVHQGVEYELDGEPARWKSPTGAVSNTVLFLVRWVG